MRPPKIIISGGGTGGQIFPAIAIADRLKELQPDAEFLFVGAIGRMEMERVPKAGYPIKGLNISGLQRSLSAKNLSFPFKVLRSLADSKKIISDFKPDVAIGVGGYASGPLLHVAARKRIPSLIQEQNSFPGITNRLLAKKVDKICVSYDGMEKWFPSQKLVMTGNPVRQSLVSIQADRKEAIQYFGLEQDIPIVLVVGGSLGARTINQSIEGAIDEIGRSNIQVIWQTGKSYSERAEELKATGVPKNLHITPFIERMDLAYSAADLIVSRAGAMALSELCLVGKPCILVPSPNVAEDHQTKNAMALVNKNAAVLVKDNEAREKLWDTIQDILNDQDRSKELGKNAKSIGIPDSSDRIAKEILELIGAN